MHKASTSVEPQTLSSCPGVVPASSIAALVSIIPTTTGAAKAIGQVSGPGAHTGG